MKSLFLRMFLWFCGATTVVVIGIAIAFGLSNPDQLPFAWPTVGRGAVVSAGRVAVDAYERGGQAELERYLASLWRDTQLRGSLFDSRGKALHSNAFAPGLPEDPASPATEQLMFYPRTHIAGIRLSGRGSKAYTFVATIPRREMRGFWSRTFIVSLVFTGGLLCFLLARHVTAPVIHLRTLTSKFSNGDLTARITLPGLLQRKDEIGGLARDFNHMASRIEALMNARQRLIGDASHELRSPITRLSLALGLIRRRRDPDLRHPIARMEREVERLNALIAQLLTLSRLEGLEQPLPMQPIDLSALVQEIAGDAGFEAVSMDRSVHLLDCPPCTMSGARELIQSAVENVVRNAVKYTNPNTQVIIRLLHVNGSQAATIVVEDEGPGVPSAALDHIFEPFYRVDDARDRRSGGTGLGLAITQQIVTLHGGAVHAANREAGGLELRITLPVSSDSPWPERPSGSAASI